MRKSYRHTLNRAPLKNGEAAFLAFAIARICSHLRRQPTERDAPSLELLQDQFGMSRATAHRWRSAWFEANGLDKPEQPRGPHAQRRRAQQLRLFDQAHS